MPDPIDSLTIENVKRAIMSLSRCERSDLRTWIFDRFDVRGFLLVDGVVVDPDEPAQGTSSTGS